MQRTTMRKMLKTAATSQLHVHYGLKHNMSSSKGRPICRAKMNHSIQIQAKTLLGTVVLLDVGGGRVVHHDKVTMIELLLDMGETGNLIMVENLAFEFVLPEHLACIPDGNYRHVLVFYEHMTRKWGKVFFDQSPHLFILCWI